MIIRIYLESHNALENKHRFYQLLIMPGLLGEWVPRALSEKTGLQPKNKQN